MAIMGNVSAFVLLKHNSDGGGGGGGDGGGDGNIGSLGPEWRGAISTRNQNAE